ncbi:HTH-type transcriptional regulator LutR [mine drainage metagenome]|uniref:HTH-type transcriptional regulator LutR n=1 Tax=mine drainage metagenome TaxID=410659 RepID=A0A1J5SD64_9ZZZZ
MTSCSTPLPEHLREQIEEAIATGLLPPGTRLDEVSLAARYGVSRTPLREALIQLAAAGFIERRAGKGWEVARVSAPRLCEMFEVMAELEGMAGRLAARRADEADHQRLLAAHQACQAARDAGAIEDFYRRNEAFHHALYAAARNGFLAEQATALHRRLRPFRRLQIKMRNRMQTSHGEHQRILEALRAGDGAAAEALLRAHIIIQGDRFTDLMALMDRLAPSAAESLAP